MTPRALTCVLAAMVTAGVAHAQPASVVRNDALLSAAFAEFAAARTAYEELHHRYLGVTQSAPNTATCAAWPAGEVGRRALRLGFISEVPLHTVDSSGRHVGFEADLAVELVRRINAHYPGARVTLEWVPVNVTLPIGPAKNATAFRALAEGLRGGKFDVAFSSIVPVQATDIVYLCPTMTMFPGVLYTGRDGLDVSGIRGRASLVTFLAAHPGLTFIHGMGVMVYDELAADVAKAGGSIALAPAGTNPHFRMADILGLTKGIAGRGMTGTLLDVNPRTDIQPKAAFALR
jgi:ABC-type amino acid transport substrate-binding protein